MEKQVKGPDYSYEARVLGQGYKYVVGTDEVGRGAGAHVVVAAAVCIPEEALSLLEGKVRDSKKMTAKRREEAYDIIIENCVYGVKDISNVIIDEINILEATKLAMKHAIEQTEYFDYVLVDGTVDLRKYITCPYENIIKGDDKSISIAAASIIAKVTRDRMMKELHEIWPLYGFNKNMGYLTKEHIEAIKTYGPCEYHRMSFRKVGR